MEAVPDKPISRRSGSLNPVDSRFHYKLNILVGLAIAILVTILVTAGAIIYTQISMSKRISRLEKNAGITKSQRQQLAGLGKWMGDVDDKLTSLSDQLDSNTKILNKRVKTSDTDADQLKALQAQVQENTTAFSETRDALNELTAQVDEHINAP